MIQEFVNRWEAHKHELRASFQAKHPESYEEIVRGVVSVVSDPDKYDRPDPTRITKIDHGEYHGTLLFVVAGSGYQTDNFWFVRVSYGSCSGCDTLQSICGYGEGAPSEDQVNQYMTLALHIVQGIKKLEDDA